MQVFTIFQEAFSPQFAPSGLNPHQLKDIFFGSTLALNPRFRHAHLCQVPTTTQMLITTVLDIHGLCSTSCSRSITATSQKRLQTSQGRIHARNSLFSMGVAKAACQATQSRLSQAGSQTPEAHKVSRLFFKIKYSLETQDLPHNKVGNINNKHTQNIHMKKSFNCVAYSFMVEAQRSRKNDEINAINK